MDVDTRIYLNQFKLKEFQKVLYDAVENKHYKRVLLIWPRRCLSGDSHITMSDGSFKLLKDIAAGDKILSWNGSEFVPDIVKNVWSAGVKESYRVKGSGSSLEIISSGDHKFAHTSCTGNRVEWDGIEKIGKYRRLLQYNGISSPAYNRDNLLPEFLGYILSDGSHTLGQQPKFTNTNMHIIDRVIQLSKALFDDAYCSVSKKGNGSDVRFTNGTRGGGFTPNPVKELLKHHALLTPKKEQRLPAIAWQWEETQILHFIAGIISGDGSFYCHTKGYKAADTGHTIPPASEITISCGPSYLYAWDLYWILRKIGIFPQCPYKERDSNWKIKIAKHYNIKKLLSVRIWGKEDKQEEILTAIKDLYKKPQLFKGSIRTGFKREKSIPIEMVDIETEVHHNFIANGYVVHNSGKDLAAFNLCIRAALRKRMVIWYIFPTFAQGRRALWDSITNDGFRFLDYIPPELIYSKNSQEMKIVFTNGSLFQVIGSDNYDALVGANPQLCVFSEYALQDPRAFQYIAPMLRANKGTAIFLSCVAPSTLVVTENGIQRIKDVSSNREEFSDLNIGVYGLGGFHNATQFYYSEQAPTRIITLNCGVKIECTPIHPLWNGQKWIQSKDLKVGDSLPVQYGQDVWGKGVDFSQFNPVQHGLKKWTFSIEKVDSDFFYLLGLIHADGNYNNNVVCVTNKKDPEIREFLLKYGFRLRKDDIHFEYSSRELCALLEYLGFKHGALNKTFPEKLLSGTKEQVIAFIQGCFDGDGHSDTNPKKYGRIKISSAALEFIQTLQVVLLNFGVVGSINKETKVGKPPSSKEIITTSLYNLTLTGYFAYQFYNIIGFRLARKQANKKHIKERCKEESGNIYPVDVTQLPGYSLPKNIVTNPGAMTRRMIKFLHERNNHPYLKSLLQEKFFYSKIKSIEESSSEVFDFVIPETHSFMSNGVISHNTVRGRNHLYALHEVAKNNPDWYVQKLSVEETQHIPIKEIEEEVASGVMSEDMARQEYWNDWDRGVDGSWYAKYLQNMRLRHQIGNVPWETREKVYTAWDLGINDYTAIIFFQVIGQTIRIIDCYQNNDEGLEHYVKVVHDKPYNYGEHILPHDVEVRELGPGVSRLQQLEEMGLNVTVCTKLSFADGIEAVKAVLPKTWIDETNAHDVIACIENYRRSFIPKLNEYSDKPIHDKYSHMADGLRYMAIMYKSLSTELTPEKIEENYQKALYKEQYGKIPYHPRM